MDTDLSAVGSREAVDYWKGLNSDLETAIADQFVGRTDPLGTRINVDIDEISLNSAFAPGANAETARLSGRVVLENPDGTQVAAYDVQGVSLRDIAAVRRTSEATIRQQAQSIYRKSAPAICPSRQPRARER